MIKFEFTYTINRFSETHNAKKESFITKKKSCYKKKLMKWYVVDYFWILYFIKYKNICTRRQ